VEIVPDSDRTWVVPSPVNIISTVNSHNNQHKSINLSSTKSSQLQSNCRFKIFSTVFKRSSDSIHSSKMPLTTLTISNDYGYVILAATSTFVVNIFHSFKTGGYRKSSGIMYPNAYATPEQAKADTNAYLLNCAQRAHANFTENQTSTITALLIGGIYYPLTAAVCGAGWSVSRYLYLTGYCSLAKPNGKGRYNGITHNLFQLVLFGLSVATGVQMVRGL